MTTVQKHRQNTLYGSNRSKEMREERNAPISEVGHVRIRHIDEKTEQGQRHRRESEQLNNEINNEIARDKNRGIHRSTDENDRRRKKLAERHQRERSDLQARHDRELERVIK